MTVPYVYSMLNNQLYYSMARYDGSVYRLDKYISRFNMFPIDLNSNLFIDYAPLIYYRFSKNFFVQLNSIFFELSQNYNKLNRIKKRTYNEMMND